MTYVLKGFLNRNDVRIKGVLICKLVLANKNLALKKMDCFQCAADTMYDSESRACAQKQPIDTKIAKTSLR